MSITQKDFQALQPGVNELSRNIAERKLAQQQAEQQQSLEQLRAYLAPKVAGQKQAAENEENIKTLQDPRLQDLVNDGGSVKAGDLSLGGNPYSKLVGQGPHQAQAFLKNAQGAYKGINDQLDASQSTLDALNQGNATSDKLALINEARLAAGAGGSRAISHMVDILSGGQTAASNFQEKLNWLQNTPNIPTLQPAQRDAIRESVFNRVPQLEQMHHTVSNQLAQQGPIIAPQADTGTLLNSMAGPAQQKLDGLKKMQADYSSARAKQSSSDISQPSIANPNPSTFDKLKSMFNFGGQQQSPSGLSGYLKPQAGTQTPNDGAHPQDGVALQWAKSNPDDPRAAKILQLNGGQ